MAEKRPIPQARTGQSEGRLSQTEFARRFHARFVDPAFRPHDAAIEQLLQIAWSAYLHARKAPLTRRAGEEFSDPDYQLSVDWLAARAAIQEAQVQHDAAHLPSRVLLICASARNDRTCPGEMSKSFRLAQLSQRILAGAGMRVDLLDLSQQTSEFAKLIHPCKACVSTAMPLCHWPCSCYPNHSLGQSPDWMAEIYPRWVAAHGIMIITPVYWYQAPSVLKLMIDRLVCADGGNPDPTRTHGKRVEEAKALELEGWNYPRHLAGRSFAVVVHGDSAGAETLRRSLVDWLSDMHLIQAGAPAVLDRYIGYYESYARSHEALDADEAIQSEVQNAARALVAQISAWRAGQRTAGEELTEPRPK
jgi:multimeric flavodoxin WrbA